MLDAYKVQGLRLLPVVDDPCTASETHREATPTPNALQRAADHAYDFGYNNPQFSDKILHVMRERPSSADLSEDRSLQSERPLLSMYVNSLTLAANSEVFRRKLENWNGAASSQELRIDVKPGEELYLQHLIRFCYTKKVDLNSEKALLRLMQLADLFLMPDCVQQCAISLGQLQLDADGVLPLSSAYRYVRLPEGLHSHQPFAQLVRRACSRLQAEFDDLDAVWANDSLRKEFLDMPLAALLVVLASPSLKSMTENTVFVAMSHWMHQAVEKKKKKGRKGGMAGAGRKLAACIRLPMLSNDFLHFVASQAEWLPEEYKTGAPFRQATRFKGAAPMLQHKLVASAGPSCLLYTPRRVGVGSTTGHMQWQVATSGVSSMKRSGPDSTLRIPGEYYLCGFYWYLIVQYNSTGTSLGCYLHWTTKLNSATEMSPAEAYVLASISLSVRRSIWGPDHVQVACMKREQNFGGGLGMGWGNPFKVEIGPGEHEGDLVRHLDSAGYVREGFLDIQFTVSVQLDA